MKIKSLPAALCFRFTFRGRGGESITSFSPVHIRDPNVAPGIVLSLAFDKNEWVVDSNVVRVFKRYFGMQTTKEGRRDSHIIATAKLFSSENNAKEANLGLVDFGAIICLPKKPICSECILKHGCEYKKQDNH